MADRVTRWTADALMAAVFTEPRWAVPGLISEGLNILVGAPKLGKSWLATNIACAVGTGGMALGRIPVKEGPVLSLSLEDTGRRLQSRLHLVLDGDEPPPHLVFETECNPWNLGGEELIRGWIDRNPAARLVIIDVFARIRSVSDGKRNRYDEDYQEMMKIKTLADQTGVAFLVVHHARKATAEDFLDLVSGTHGLAGAADTILALTRARTEHHGILNVTGRDVEEVDYPLVFSHGVWTMLDGTASELEMSDTRRRIFQALRFGGSMTPKEMAELLSISHANAKQMMGRMAGDGQITSTGDGGYRLLP